VLLSREKEETRHEHIVCKQGGAGDRRRVRTGPCDREGIRESGAAVVLADWDEAAARSAADELAAQGHEALAIDCDVADDAQVEAMVEQTVATFGRLDAAYNNAGVQNVLAETADATREDFDRVNGDQSAWRVELHEVRAAPDAQARQRRDRELLLDRRTDRRRRARNLSRRPSTACLGSPPARHSNMPHRAFASNAVCPGLIQTPMSDQMMAAWSG
jgi:hypothetical protein